MQESNELQNYLPDDSEQLITKLADLNEELQTENELQKMKLSELNCQKQTALSDNQRLSAELQAVLQDLKRLKIENKSLQVQIQKDSSERQTLLSELQILTEKLSAEHEQGRMLYSENQKLISRVRQVTAENESLQNSDLELKKAEELQKKNALDLKKIEEEKKRLKKEMTGLCDRENSLNGRERAVAKRESNIGQTEKEIKLTAEKKTRAEIASAERKYKNISEKEISAFKDKFELSMWFLSMYAIATTLFTALSSNRILSDVVSAGKTTSKCVLFFEDFFDTIGEIASGVGENINQPVVSAIVSGIAGILAELLRILIVIGFIGFVVAQLISVYKDCCCNWYSFGVLLATVGVLVWFADTMPMNVVLLLILSHLVYMFIQWYIKGYRENHNPDDIFRR